MPDSNKETADPCQVSPPSSRSECPFDSFLRLSTTSGVTVQDTISKFEYPMPYYSSGKDDVFVGRIREDFSCTNSINLWIVADNLRKGAATNAIQIAEKVVKKFF